MTSTQEVLSLRSEQIVVEEALARLVGCGVHMAGGDVAEAMSYSVMGGGQRLRPVLAVRMGRMLDSDMNLVLRGAVAVELVHCASLIIDDLPCMDDEHFRRDRPTVHRQFGESTAILAAFSLVALAARHTLEGITNSATLREMSSFQQKLLRLLDCNSLVGGQALDLSLQANGSAPSRRCAELKTAPLFKLAARAGLAGAPINADQKNCLTRFGHEFGVAYQLMDDLCDGEQHLRAPFEAQMESTRSLLQPFGDRSQGLAEMLDYLYAKSLS